MCVLSYEMIFVKMGGCTRLDILSSPTIHELSFMTDHQEGGSPTNTVPAPGRPEPD